MRGGMPAAKEILSHRKRRSFLLENKLIYVDNAATTPISKEVLDAMMPWLTEGYGNASSIYSKGREAGWALKAAREKAAEVLGAEPSEIYFTSCGSESDNWALKGAMQTLAKRGKKHIITTAFEHHAILHTCKALEKQGFEVTYLPVYENGIVRVEDVEAAIRPDTGLVSIMYANNEIGTIQPIKEIGALCRERKIWFHTDAVQAVGHVPINVVDQNIDMLSLSGHKIHAQKGIGLLYVKKGIVLPNLIDGGGQEKGKRAGTENVAAIVGLAKALEIANTDIEERAAKTRVLRDKLIDNILKIERTRLNGDREKRLAGNVNISIEGIEGESLLLSLDMYGICASSGSACTSGSLDPSHVLLSIGLPHEVAHGSLRLSIGEYNTMEEIDHICAVVPQVVQRLRDMSPVWDELEKGQRKHLI